jgi:putative SOS response-associated peptidase YedK
MSGVTKQPFILDRHSGMLLAGIHQKQSPKTWIPAQTIAGMTRVNVLLS